MDVIEYMSIRRHMCNSCSCCECPLNIDNNGEGEQCNAFEINHPDSAVNLVYAWSKSNYKTRQTEFVKLHPNVKLDKNGCIDIQPCYIDSSYNKDSSGHIQCKELLCHQCRRNYWSEVISND